MAIAKVADRGSNANAVFDNNTIVDLPSGASITVGNYLIAYWAIDNSGLNGAATVTTITDPRSNTWTLLTAANNDPGAANAGITCRVAYCKVVNPYSNGDDLTWDYNDNTTAKAIMVTEWSGIHGTSPIAVAQTQSTGASTTPASAAKTPGTAGQMFFAAWAVEGPSADTVTEDSDTTDGSWVTLTRLSTVTGTAASNTTINAAYKLVTGTTAQTYNPTAGTSRDWAMCAVIFDTATVPVAVTGAATLGGATATATVGRTVNVAASAPLGAATAAATVRRTVAVVSAALLGAATAAAAVTRTVAATGAATLGAAVATGTVTVSRTIDIAGAASLGAVAATATVHRTVNASGAATLGTVAAASTAQRTVNIAAQAHLGSAVATLTIQRAVAAAGTASLGTAAAHATAVRTVFVTGGTALGAVVAHATIAGPAEAVVPGTLHASLTAPSLATSNATGLTASTRPTSTLTPE